MAVNPSPEFFSSELAPEPAWQDEAEQVDHGDLSQAIANTTFWTRSNLPEEHFVTDEGVRGLNRHAVIDLSSRGDRRTIATAYVRTQEYGYKTKTGQIEAIAVDDTFDNHRAYGALVRGIIATYRHDLEYLEGAPGFQMTSVAPDLGTHLHAGWKYVDLTETSDGVTTPRHAFIRDPEYKPPGPPLIGEGW